MIELPDTLLRAHAAAWWRDIEAPDFVEQVDATYAAYLAGGGSDAHEDANWRAFSDAAKAAAGLLTDKRARPLPMDGADFHTFGEE